MWSMALERVQKLQALRLYGTVQIFRFAWAI